METFAASNARFLCLFLTALTQETVYNKNYHFKNCAKIFIQLGLIHQRNSIPNFGDYFELVRFFSVHKKVFKKWELKHFYEC